MRSLAKGYTASPPSHTRRSFASSCPTPGTKSPSSRQSWGGFDAATGCCSCGARSGRGSSLPA
eukprot:7199914-Prymnesium_polylepis.1